MELNMVIGIAGFLAGVLLALAVAWFQRKQRRSQMELAQNTAARIIEEAKKEANAIKKEAEIQARDGIFQIGQ